MYFMNESWKKLLHGRLNHLLDLAQKTPLGDVSAISRLRKHGTLDEVSVVLEAIESRRRSASRLLDAPLWLMDREGMEQATRTRVAEHKAKRIRQHVGNETVIDLCCGIGSDASALARDGSIIYVDRDPLRVELTRFNLSASHSDAAAHHPLVADAERLPLPPLPIHVDPARRQGARRVYEYSEMIPGPEVIEGLIQHHGSVALKCGPGVDIENLPSGEVEWIQDGSDLVEATLWTGSWAGSTRRTATLVDRNLQISGEFQHLQQSSLKEPAYLHEPCSVIERSGLVGHVQPEVAAGEWHPGLGWLAGQENRTSPWFRTFAVVAQFGWHEKKVVDWFRQKGCAPKAIKTRGVKEDPAQLRRRFSGDAGDWILALLRRGQRIEACVLEEQTHSESSK